MWAMLLFLGGCGGPALAPWAGTWALSPGAALDNTCPVAADALVDALGVGPTAAGEITLTVDRWMKDDGAIATWCLDADCAAPLDGWATPAAGAIGLHDTLVRGVDGCEITVELALIAHCADPEACAAPSALVDAEVTGLDGASCAVFEAGLQAESGIAAPLLGCDAAWFAPETPLDDLASVQGTFEVTARAVPYNTGPLADEAALDTPDWLLVGEEARACADESGAACEPGAGPVVLEAGAAVWRASYDAALLEGRGDVDCTVHSESLAVLLPDEEGLTLITDAEWAPAPVDGDDCEVVWDLLQMGAGAWDPDTHADVIEVRRLRR